MDHVWYSFSWVVGVLCVLSACFTHSGLWFFGGCMIILMSQIAHYLYELMELLRQAKVKPSDVVQSE